MLFHFVKVPTLHRPENIPFTNLFLVPYEILDHQDIPLVDLHPMPHFLEPNDCLQEQNLASELTWFRHSVPLGDPVPAPEHLARLEKVHNLSYFQILYQPHECLTPIPDFAHFQ